MQQSVSFSGQHPYNAKLSHDSIFNHSKQDPNTQTSKQLTNLFKSFTQINQKNISKLKDAHTLEKLVQINIEQPSLPLVSEQFVQKSTNNSPWVFSGRASPSQFLPFNAFRNYQAAKAKTQSSVSQKLSKNPTQAHSKPTQQGESSYQSPSGVRYCHQGPHYFKNYQAQLQGRGDTSSASEALKNIDNDPKLAVRKVVKKMPRHQYKKKQLKGPATHSNYMMSKYDNLRKKNYKQDINLETYNNYTKYQSTARTGDFRALSSSNNFFSNTSKMQQRKQQNTTFQIGSKTLLDTDLMQQAEQQKQSTSFQQNEFQASIQGATDEMQKQIMMSVISGKSTASFKNHQNNNTHSNSNTVKQQKLSQYRPSTSKFTQRYRNSKMQQIQKALMLSDAKQQTNSKQYERIEKQKLKSHQRMLSQDQLRIRTTSFTHAPAMQFSQIEKKDILKMIASSSSSINQQNATGTRVTTASTAASKRQSNQVLSGINYSHLGKIQSVKKMMMPYHNLQQACSSFKLPQLDMTQEYKKLMINKFDQSSMKRTKFKIMRQMMEDAVKSQRLSIGGGELQQSMMMMNTQSSFFDQNGRIPHELGDIPMMRVIQKMQLQKKKPRTSQPSTRKQTAALQTRRPVTTDNTYKTRVRTIDARQSGINRKNTTDNFFYNHHILAQFNSSGIESANSTFMSLDSRKKQQISDMYEFQRYPQQQFLVYQPEEYDDNNSSNKFVSANNQDLRNNLIPPNMEEQDDQEQEEEEQFQMKSMEENECKVKRKHPKSAVVRLPNPTLFLSKSLTSPQSLKNLSPLPNVPLRNRFKESFRGTVLIQRRPSLEQLRNQIKREKRNQEEDQEADVLIDDQDVKSPKSIVQENRAERKTILSLEKKQPLSLAQQVLTFSSVTQLQTGQDAVPSPVFHGKIVDKKQKSNIMRTGGGGQSTVVGLARLAKQGYPKNYENNFTDSQLSGNTRRKIPRQQPSQQKMKNAVGSLTPSEWRSARSRVLEPIHSNIYSSNNTNYAPNKYTQRMQSNNTDLASQLPLMTAKSNITSDDGKNVTYDYTSKHNITSPSPNEVESRRHSPYTDKKYQRHNEATEQTQDEINAQSNHKSFRPNRFKRFPRFTIIFKKQQNFYSSLRNTYSDPQTESQKFLTAAIENKRNKLLQQHQLKYFDVQSIKQFRYNQQQKIRNSLQGSKQKKMPSSKNSSRYQPQQAIYINLSPHIINQLVIEQQQKQQQTGEKTSNRSNNISSNQLTMLKGGNTFNRLQNISAHSLLQQQQQGSKQHLKSKQSQGTSPRWGMENQSMPLPPIARQLTSGIQLAPDASKQLIATNKTPRLRSAGSAVNFEIAQGGDKAMNKKSLGEFKNMSSKNTKRTEQYMEQSYDEDDQGFKMFDPFERVLLTSSGGIDNAMITSTRTMQRLNNILSPFSYKIIHTNFIPKPISNFFKTSQKRSQLQQFGKRQNSNNSPSKRYQISNVVQNIGYIAPLVVKQRQTSLSGYMSDVDYVSSTLRESIAMGHENQALWQAYLAARGSQEYSGAQSVETKGALRFINGAISNLSAVKQEERLTGDQMLPIQQQQGDNNAIAYNNENDGEKKINSPSFGARSQNQSQKQITLMQGEIGAISRNENLEEKNKYSKDDSTLENSKITMGPINLSQEKDLRASENFQNLNKNLQIDQAKYHTEVKNNEYNSQSKMSSSKKKRKYYTTSMKTPPLHVGNIQVSEGGLSSPPNESANIKSDRKISNNNNNIEQSSDGQRSPTPIAKQLIAQKQKTSTVQRDENAQQSNFYIHTVAKDSMQSLSLNLQQSLDHQDKKQSRKKINESPLRIKMVTNKEVYQQKRNTHNDMQEDSLYMIGGLSKMQYAASKMATTAAKSLQKRQELKINLVRPFDISRRDSNQQNATTSFNWNNNQYKLKPQASAPRVNNAFVPKVVPKFMKNTSITSQKKPVQTYSIKNSKQLGITIRNQNQALAQIPDFQDNRRQLYKNRPSTTGKKSPPLNFKIQRDSGSLIGNVKRFSQVQANNSQEIHHPTTQQFYLNNSSIGLSINNSIGQAANDSLSQGTGPTALQPRPMTVHLKSGEQSLYRNSNSLIDENSLQDDSILKGNLKPMTRGMVKIRQQKGEIREIERDGASKAAQVFKDGRRFVDYEKRTSSPVGMRNQEFIWDKARMISFRKMSHMSKMSTVTTGKKKSTGELVKRPNTGGGRGYKKNYSGIIKNL